MLFGVGGCNAGMPGYAICPVAERLLVRHQPLLLKLHRHSEAVCVIPMGLIACLLELAMEMLEKPESGEWTTIAEAK